MTRLLSKASLKKGLPPGTIVHIGKDPLPTTIEYIRYNEKKIEEIDTKNDKSFRDVPDSVDWVHVKGLLDIDRISKIGEILQIHPLMIEDIFNENQRPKAEEMDQGIFVALKYMSYDKEKKQINIDHISIVLKGNIVISFQNSDCAIFDMIRERLYKANGRIRTMQADYLLYALCDVIIDNYFVVLEQLDDDIESLEDILIDNPQNETLQHIYRLKREVIMMRRAVWPMREAIATLNRTDNPIIKEPTHIFYRDLYDHAIQVIDTMETFRDMISGMLDMYLTSVSNKMNEVMKVLTIFAAIFIPLTFIAGVYGMNFEFMPELPFRWAYPIWWCVTIIIGVGMLIFFKKKKWL